MTLRFAHTMIQVRDIEAAIAFYRKALGFALADRHVYEGAELVYLRRADDPFELELLHEEPWAFAERPEHGRSHIAFTVDNLEAEHAKLSAAGIAVGPITPHRANGKLQTRYFYFDDPEGNQIEILEAVGRYAQGG
jgi:lactoylglutathione lyase